ncbi:MAG: hypothetical protein MZV64_03935 [Ignavibacteriales bacterium]|nr:hypothetical protein [Ignavibacteriales bacterium]
MTNTAQEISAGKFDIQAQVDSADGRYPGASLQQHGKTNGEMRSKTWTTTPRNWNNKLYSELTSLQSKKRAQQLQTIAEIARYISTERELNKLLPLITQTVVTNSGSTMSRIFSWMKVVNLPSSSLPNSPRADRQCFDVL